MGNKIPNPNMNAHLSLKSHARNLYVMSDKQLEFTKTLLKWLHQKRSSDPKQFSRHIITLNNIVRTRQYNSEDRSDLNKLRELYISEKT